MNPWTGSFGNLTEAFLLAVFIYWGWDCCLCVNEETEDSARTPGQAAVVATLILVAIFTVVSGRAVLRRAGVARIARRDVLGPLGTAVLGRALGKLLVLAC